MSHNRITRKLENSKLGKIPLISTPPSPNSLSEGEEVLYVDRKGGSLITYRKQNGAMWSSAFEKQRTPSSGGKFKPKPKRGRSGGSESSDFERVNIGSSRRSGSSNLNIDSQNSTVFSSKVKANDFSVLLKNRVNRIDSFSGIAFDATEGREDNGIGACIAGLADNAATDLHDTNLVFATNDANVDGLTERVRITNDGKVGIGTSSPSAVLDVTGDVNITGAFTSPGIDDNADANAITIDSSERVGIGTGSTALDEEFTVAIGGATSAPVMNLDAYSAGGGYYGYVNCRKSNSNTVGTLTATDSNDYIGGMTSWGVGSGGARAVGAYFYMKQTAASGPNYVPTEFVLRTSSNSGLQNALTADSTGAVDIPVSLEIGSTGTAITDIIDSDSLSTSDATLSTTGNVKAYADTMLPLAGGTMTGDLILSGTGTDIVLTATAKLRLDGSASGDSYIYEHGADSVRIFVGGDEMLRLTEGGTTGNEIFVKEGCFTFTQITEAFSSDALADEGSGTGGTHDTDIDFRHTNKIKLAVTADMNDMNLIFPAGSGNFQLLVTYNGDHDIDSWKAWTKTAQEASVANVLWPGGTEPDPTASGVDIFSFFWDAETETAYGVASLNFVAGD